MVVRVARDESRWSNHDPARTTCISPAFANFTCANRLVPRLASNAPPLHCVSRREIYLLGGRCRRASSRQPLLVGIVGTTQNSGPSNHE